MHQICLEYDHENSSSVWVVKKSQSSIILFFEATIMLKQEKSLSSWLRENPPWTAYSLKITRSRKDPHYIIDYKRKPRATDGTVVITYPSKQLKLTGIDVLAQDKQNGNINALHTLFSLHYLNNNFPSIEFPSKPQKLTSGENTYEVVMPEDAHAGKIELKSSEKTTFSEKKQLDSLLNDFVKQNSEIPEEKEQEKENDQEDSEGTGSRQGSINESTEENDNSNSANISDDEDSEIESLPSNNQEEKIPNREPKNEIPRKTHSQAYNQFTAISHELTGKLSEEQTIQALTAQDALGRTPALSLFALSRNNDPLKQEKLNYLCEILRSVDGKKKKLHKLIVMRDKNGKNLLHYLCMNGQLTELKQFLAALFEDDGDRAKKYIRAALMQRDHDGLTPLHYALLYAEKEVANDWFAAEVKKKKEKESEEPEAKKNSPFAMAQYILQEDYLSAADLKSIDNGNRFNYKISFMMFNDDATNNIYQKKITTPSDIILRQDRSNHNKNALHCLFSQEEYPFYNAQKEKQGNTSDDSKEKEKEKETPSQPLPINIKETANDLSDKEKIELLTALDSSKKTPVHYLFALKSFNQENFNYLYYLLQNVQEKNAKLYQLISIRDTTGKNLLHYLCMHGKQLQFEQLLDVLFDDLKDESAKKYIHAALMQCDMHRSTPIHYALNALAAHVQAMKEQEKEKKKEEKEKKAENKQEIISSPYFEIVCFMLEKNYVTEEELKDLFSNNYREIIDQIIESVKNNKKSESNQKQAVEKDIAGPSSLPASVSSPLNNSSSNRNPAQVSNSQFDANKFILAFKDITQLKELLTTAEWKNSTLLNKATIFLAACKENNAKSLIKLLCQHTPAAELYQITHDDKQHNYDKQIDTALKENPQFNKVEFNQIVKNRTCFIEMYHYFETRWKERKYKGETDLNERISDFVTIINNISNTETPLANTKEFFKKEHRFFKGTERYQQHKIDFVDYVITLEPAKFNILLEEFKAFLLEKPDVEIARKILVELQAPQKDLRQTMPSRLSS